MRRKQEVYVVIEILYCRTDLYDVMLLSEKTVHQWLCRHHRLEIHQGVCSNKHMI